MKIYASTSALDEPKSILPAPTSDIQNHKCIQFAPHKIHYIMKEDETGVFVIGSGIEKSSSSFVTILILLAAVVIFLMYIMICLLYRLTIINADLDEKVTSANASSTTALF